MIQAHNTDTNILKHHSCQYKYSGTLKWFSTSVIKVSCSKYPFSITKPMSQSLIWNCSEYHQTCEPTHAFSMLRCVMFLHVGHSFFALVRVSLEFFFSSKLVLLSLIFLSILNPQEKGNLSIHNNYNYNI